jgi:hypothetical protein
MRQVRRELTVTFGIGSSTPGGYPTRLSTSSSPMQDHERAGINPDSFVM